MKIPRFHLPACVALVAGTLIVAAHVAGQIPEYVAMHRTPPGLRQFDAQGPIPEYARWRDSMPKQRDPDAYQLYMRARKLWRSKIEWQLTRQEAQGIFKDVEHAAQLGDWGARALLAQFYRAGLGPLESNHVLDPAPEKSIEIIRTAIAAGQAWGYYDMGVAYENGVGGIEADAKMAWAYYRRAAELGSPEAQMTLAAAYDKENRRDAAFAMTDCAYLQEHGPAARDFGIRAKFGKKYLSAVMHYQNGAKWGNPLSAASLMMMFDVDNWNRMSDEEKQEYRRLNILADPERSTRYFDIVDALRMNPDLKLSRLDEVLPLPPAELPPWKGIDDALSPEPSGPPTY